MWHFQGDVPNWPDVIPDTICIKAIDRGDILKQAKLINPKVITILRHHVGNQVFGGTWDENVQRARWFFSCFIDETFDRDFAPYVDCIEEYNEYLASSHTPEEIEERYIHAKAHASVWKYEYRTQPKYAHIKLILCNTAVGNIIPCQFGELAMEYDCLLGYHPYTLWENKQRPDWEWDNLSGLFATLEECLWPDHVKPTWIFTEAGPFRNAADGWRHPDVLDHDIDAYVEAIRLWIEDVKGTPAYKEGRVVGFNLFNTGGTAEWKWYETDTDNMRALAPMIKSLWVPVAPPTPPPPPAPVEVADISRHQGAINWPLFKQECESRNVHGLIIRCTLGVAGVDDRFIEYWHNAKAQDWWDMSVYHLFRPEYTGEAQADHLLNTIENLGIELDFYPVLDCEIDGGLPPEVISDKITKFYTRIEQRMGWLPITYTGAWWWNPHTVRGTGRGYLHVAYYAPNPVLPYDWDDYLLHQYTSSAVFKGVPQNTVDLNRFNGTLDDWHDFLDEFQGDDDDCWGQPREQYKRVVWVAGTHINEQIRKEIYTEAAIYSITCTGSYDDAGVGMFVDNTAILWDITVELQPVFEEFYAMYYPHTRVVFKRWVSVDWWSKVRERLNL